MMTERDGDSERKEEADASIKAAEVTIPVIKETLRVERAERVTGTVEIRKTVKTEASEVPIFRTTTKYREERVPVNRPVEAVPETRLEGDRIIVPVVREEVVVTKRLILVEEIHLIKEVSTTEGTETVELRQEQVTIERRPTQD